MKVVSFTLSDGTTVSCLPSTIRSVEVRLMRSLSPAEPDQWFVRVMVSDQSSALAVVYYDDPISAKEDAENFSRAMGIYAPEIDPIGDIGRMIRKPSSYSSRAIGATLILLVNLGLVLIALHRMSGHQLYPHEIFVAGALVFGNIIMMSVLVKGLVAAARRIRAQKLLLTKPT